MMVRQVEHAGQGQKRGAAEDSSIATESVPLQNTGLALDRRFSKATHFRWLEVGELGIKLKFFWVFFHV